MMEDSDVEADDTGTNNLSPATTTPAKATAQMAGGKHVRSDDFDENDNGRILLTYTPQVDRTDEAAVEEIGGSSEDFNSVKTSLTSKTAENLDVRSCLNETPKSGS